MDWISQSKLVLSLIRGDMLQYILIGNSCKYGLGCYSVFSLKFFIPSPWRVSSIIQFPSNDLGPPFVDHPSHYLSLCRIGHPLWLSMSWCSHCSTVQGSFPHKYNQKVSYRAFNAVAIAFSQIFLGSHFSSTFVMHAPINGVSWKVTLSDRICIRFALRLSEEALLLRPHFPTFLSACYL